MAKDLNNKNDFNDPNFSEDNNDSEGGLEDDLEDDDLLSDIDDDLFNDEIEETDEKLSQGSAEKSHPNKNHSTDSSTKPKGMLPPEEIPVTIVVEMGQISMTMDQLLKLEPGNLLDINLHPENGVDLTINGKMVGRGELFRMGDVIGVRILELGSQ